MLAENISNKRNENTGYFALTCKYVHGTLFLEQLLRYLNEVDASIFPFMYACEASFMNVLFGFSPSEH